MEITRDSIKEPFWAMRLEEVERVLSTRLASGLAEAEASRRRALFGTNTIRERQRLTKTKLILNQFRSPLILVLVAAGVITIFLGEWIETAVIFAAVAANTLLGFWQENKAESVLELLRGYIRTRARVRREGGERELDASLLVPGDMVRVSQGDQVPADGRLAFANNLAVDEATLTGESLPVEKDPAPLGTGTALADRTSMLFSGTLVLQGFGDLIITATGSDTEFGKIARLVTLREREATPLQREIHRFSVRAGVILGALVLLLFLLGISTGTGLFDMFLLAVAIAVSAVPEGLPIALTVILAVGVERLATRNAIVRRLLAAEALGSASIILTDKTGTLTQAKMELSAVLPYRGSGSGQADEVLRASLANVDVVIENPADPPDAWRLVGNPVEVALVRGAAREGVLLPALRVTTETLDRLPFGSRHKFSASISRTNSETRLVLVGAPEVVLSYTALAESERSTLLQEVEARARGGERVLGVGSRDILPDHEDILHSQRFTNLEFKGLLTFRDPLRPGVAQAIRRVGELGVKTVIVTGDHRGTAEAVARSLGMADGKGAVLTGEELHYLTPEELKARAPDVAVFARVTPEEKLMLTALYQERGEVVAVTGDGVNDAPALERADIGIAVGSGSDVAKSAADLVLLDDNYETIVEAIEEGRRILDNIRKVIVYVLSDSLDELFLIGGSFLMGLPLPLNALQILFVNFFSDSFPAVAFAFERPRVERRDHHEKQRPGVFDRRVRFLVLVVGVATSALLFVLYSFLLSRGFAPVLTRTFIFASFASYTLFLAFSLRSLETSILRYNPFSNSALTAGVGIGLALIALAIYLPFLQQILGTVPLPPLWLVGVGVVGLANIALVEGAKWLFAKRIIKVD